LTIKKTSFNKNHSPTNILIQILVKPQN